MTAKRNVQVHFRLTPEEAARLKEDIKKSGVKKESAYLRKMVLDGHWVEIDLSDVKELGRLLSINANNLNQYAKKANECGAVYMQDIWDLQKQQKDLQIGVQQILRRLIELEKQ